MTVAYFSKKSRLCCLLPKSQLSFFNKSSVIKANICVKKYPVAGTKYKTVF